jgi:FKBP12-rapamycin complex-associated protein
MLLGKLMASSRTLIKPYAEPILKAILPKLRDPSPGVAARVMFSLGELAQVSGPDIGKYMDDLMTVIIETLQDQSSVTKREAALSTLGKLVIATGYVIDPYSKYPNLLNMVLNFLKTEQQMSIRREAVKLLGILGALDPYRHKV